MTDECIVWEIPDGGVRYATCPAKGKRPGETKAEWLHRVFLKTTRDNYPGAKRILNATIPNGEPFRPGAQKLFYPAWRHSGGGSIVIDMPEARGIRMAELRAERNRRLGESDGSMMQANEQGDLAIFEPLKLYRQQLRDLPAAIDLSGIETPETLTVFEPQWPIEP